MATYYIYRKDIPGTLSPLLLEHYAKAFRTLYCGMRAGHPELKMVIRGEWPDAFNGDGLYLKYSNAEIVEIGRKYVTVEFKNDEGQLERAKLELTPGRDKGFTEIMFIDMNGAQ